MARKITDNVNYTAPDSVYPYGAIKDNPGDGTGTKVSTVSNGDLQQFFQRIAANAGITLNSLPDNVTNGFQFVEALNTLINQESSALAETVGADGLTPVHASGVVVATVGGFTSITEGWVYYNNRFCYAAPIVSMPVTAGVLLATITDWDAIPKITWSYASTVTDATHFPHSIMIDHPLITLDARVAVVESKLALSGWNTPSAATGWSAGGSPAPRYANDGLRTVYCQGVMLSSSSSPGATLFTLAAGYRPSRDINKAVSMYNATSTGWTTVNLVITSAGVVSFRDSAQLPTATNWGVFIDFDFLTT